MVEAASKRQDGNIDVKERLEFDNDEEEGNIAALYGDQLYHTGQDELEGLEKIEYQAQFGYNTQQDMSIALNQRTEEANLAGFSPQGCISLKEIFGKHNKVFGLKLGIGGTSKVAPMNISIMEGKKPIRVKAHKCRERIIRKRMDHL